ncbi:MAG: TetR/AcrR family transcriptional regulator [Pseudomonadota bacterium]
MTAAPRLTRTQWLDLALGELSRAGPEALKLDAICIAAGKTKGSFYHHFADHDAFLLAVTRRWIDVQTERLAEQFPTKGMRESDLREILGAILQIDFRLEAAIRHLAETHDGVANLVRETDIRRMDLTADVYAQRFELDDACARDLALVDYAAFLGLAVIAPEMSPERHMQLYDLYDEMVLARYGPSKLED